MPQTPKPNPVWSQAFLKKLLVSWFLYRQKPSKIIPVRNKSPGAGSGVATKVLDGDPPWYLITGSTRLNPEEKFPDNVTMKVSLAPEIRAEETLPPLQLLLVNAQKSTR